MSRPNGSTTVTEGNPEQRLFRRAAASLSGAASCFAAISRRPGAPPELAAYAQELRDMAAECRAGAKAAGCDPRLERQTARLREELSRVRPTYAEHAAKIASAENAARRLTGVTESGSLPG